MIWRSRSLPPFSPHTRGCSCCWWDWGYRRGFSPHTRGCSHHLVRQDRRHGVFPAYTGMFLIGMAPAVMLVRFPRIRGDVPLTNSREEQGTQFSPHTRGCSYVRPAKGGGVVVFPAYAEMFLARNSSRVPRKGFLRIRGDVPHSVPLGLRSVQFSPHTRGYSRSKTCNEEDSSEKNLVNKEAYSASRLSALVTT